MQVFKIALYFLLFFGIMSCHSDHVTINPLKKDDFNRMLQGKQVQLFSLENKNGMYCEITNYGGRVVSLWVKDKNGQFDDIVLGFDKLEGYLNANEIYFGALIGRYGNRIANGKFTLNDSVYTLAQNNGLNHLHGGQNGFCNVVWNARQVSDSELELSYISKDGEEGYPGKMEIIVHYNLTDKNELKITYTAKTDQETPVNLTHHSFFNLLGAGKGTINEHVLQIFASNYTPILDGLIPTGEIASVENTPFDFRQPISINTHLSDENEQLKFGFGYDHNFVLDGQGLRLAAKVLEPNSGRVMDVFTDEPGLQFYGGNFLNGNDIGKNNLPYEYRGAFCLESQHFPDSPNQPNFPSAILKPGELYHSTCIYQFSVQR